MKPMLGLVIVALAAFGGIAIAQPAAPPIPKLVTLADEPVSGQPGLHALIGHADWPVGAATPRHIHPGDEYATVLEGEIAITNDGEQPRIYKAGQAYHNARGVIHTAKNVGNGPAQTAIVLVIDKGAEPTIPAK